MNRGYGFVDAGPAGRIYAVTSDYDDIARNHCAATMMVNLMLERCGEEQVCRDLRELFWSIHGFIGNGPVLYLARRANRYLVSEGISLICRQTSRRITERYPRRLLDLAHREVTAGRPCALLVAASPLNWHWVLAIGMESNRAGMVRLHIVDGWHARRLYTYVPDQGSRLLAVATFRA